MKYVDEQVTKDGPCRYTLYASNEAGEGEHGNIFAYVGHDWPGTVGNAHVKVEEGCASATLSWSAPTEGFNGGYFTPEGISYKILRMPDEATVAEGLTATTFTDKSLRRLGRYSYSVVACNQYGESETKIPGTYVMGKALDIPLTQDFSDLTYFLNQWQAIDANNDGFTWTYYSPYGYYQFGNTIVCIEYLLNPTIGVAESDADEWIITPPLNFEASKAYQIRVTARSITEELLDVTMARTNAIEDQQVIGLIPVEPSDGTPMPTTDYVVKLPQATEGIHCIGLHLRTELPFDGYTYLQIAGIQVEEVDQTGIADATMQTGVIMQQGSQLILPQGTENATLYNMSGREVMKTQGNGMSTETLPAGVYLLRLTANGKTLTSKISVAK